MHLELKAIILAKLMTKIQRDAFSAKWIIMITVCQLSLLLIFLVNSNSLNIDLSGVSINKPLALPTVFFCLFFVKKHL